MRGPFFVVHKLLSNRVEISYWHNTTLPVATHAFKRMRDRMGVGDSNRHDAAENTRLTRTKAMWLVHKDKVILSHGNARAHGVDPCHEVAMYVLAKSPT